MKTANEMIIAVGVEVLVRCEEMQIQCIVTDVKSVWGKERVQVKPLCGEGKQWVEMGRVSEVKWYRQSALKSA